MSEFTWVNKCIDNDDLLYHFPPQPSKGEKNEPIIPLVKLASPNPDSYESRMGLEMQNLFISDLHLTCCQYPLGKIYDYWMGNKNQVIYKWALPTTEFELCSCLIFFPGTRRVVLSQISSLTFVILNKRMGWGRPNGRREIHLSSPNWGDPWCTSYRSIDLEKRYRSLIHNRVIP